MCMQPANERRHYVATSSLIGWMHARNDPWCWICHNFIRVATVRSKSGNCKSGNFVICYQSQGIVREFRVWSISMHNFHRLVNDIWTRTKSWIVFKFKYPTQYWIYHCFLPQAWFMCPNICYSRQMSNVGRKNKEKQSRNTLKLKTVEFVFFYIPYCLFQIKSSILS